MTLLPSHMSLIHVYIYLQPSASPLPRYVLAVRAPTIIAQDTAISADQSVRRGYQEQRRIRVMPLGTEQVHSSRIWPSTEIFLIMYLLPKTWGIGPRVIGPPKMNRSNLVRRKYYAQYPGSFPSPGLLQRNGLIRIRSHIIRQK